MWKQSTEAPPRHLVTPSGLDLKESGVGDGTLGVFCSSPIREGQLYGPYAGEVILEGHDSKVDYRYAWEVYDSDNKLLHIINATKPETGNWMRYVNCARYFEEQNIVSVQIDSEIFYKAIRDIPAGEELKTWFSLSYQMQKKMKKKRKSVEVLDAEDGGSNKKKQKAKLSSDPVDDMGTPLLYEIMTSDTKLKKISKQVSEESRKKKHKLSKCKSTGNIDVGMLKGSAKPGSTPVKRPQSSNNTPIKDLIVISSGISSHDEKKSGTPKSSPKKALKVKDLIAIQDAKNGVASKCDLNTPKKVPSAKTKTPNGSPKAKGQAKVKSEMLPDLGLAGMVLHTEFQPKYIYQFELRPEHQMDAADEKKTYTCDICQTAYHHAFSLKRHFLRCHINAKYLPLSDITNCLINVVQQEAAVRSCKNNAKRLADKKKGDSESTDDSLPGVYRCYLCSELFDGLGELKTHTSEHHWENGSNRAKKFLCDRCDMRFSHKNNLVRHQETHVDSKGTCCPVCGKNFNKESNMKKHLQFHINKNFVCTVCFEKFDTGAELRKHARMEHNSSEFKLAMNRKDASSVTSKIPRNNSQKVKVMDKKAKVKKKPAEGPSNKSGSKDISGNKSNCSSGRSTPVGDVESPVPCPVCKKLFSSVPSMKKHVQFHGQRRFTCRFCFDKFPHPFGLRKHLWSFHTAQMKQHLNSTPGVTRKAPIFKTKKMFTLEEAMKESAEVLKQDLSEIDLEVKQEPKSSQEKSVEIKSEQKEGPKPLKKTTQDNTSKASVDKPFSCQVCGKAFPSESNMKMHLQYHFGRSFSCRFCFKKFPHPASLRKHLNSEHPEGMVNGVLIKKKPDIVIGPDGKRMRRRRKKKVLLELENFLKDTKSSLPSPVKTEVKKEPEEPKDAEEAERQESDHLETISHESEEEDLWEEEIRITKELKKKTHLHFSCVVCKKKFNTYVNMCRHKRLAHRVKKYGMPTLTRQRIAAKLQDCVVVNDYIPITPAEFYSNVADNIATNLDQYIDGKQEALIKYERTCSFPQTKVPESEDGEEFEWAKYNFPRAYTPWDGIKTNKENECLLTVYEKFGMPDERAARRMRRSRSSSDASFDVETKETEDEASNQGFPSVQNETDIKEDSEKADKAISEMQAETTANETAEGRAEKTQTIELNAEISASESKESVLDGQVCLTESSGVPERNAEIPTSESKDSVLDGQVCLTESSGVPEMNAEIPTSESKVSVLDGQACLTESSGVPEMNAEIPTSESIDSVLDGQVCLTESSGVPEMNAEIPTSESKESVLDGQVCLTESSGVPEMNAEIPTSESKESVLDGQVCLTESSGVPEMNAEIPTSETKESVRDGQVCLAESSGVPEMNAEIPTSESKESVLDGQVCLTESSGISEMNAEIPTSESKESVLDGQVCLTESSGVSEMNAEMPTSESKESVLDSQVCLTESSGVPERNAEISTSESKESVRDGQVCLAESSGITEMNAEIRPSESKESVLDGQVCLTESSGVPEMNAEIPTSESKESVLDGQVCLTESSGVPEMNAEIPTSETKESVRDGQVCLTESSGVPEMNAEIPTSETKESVLDGQVCLTESSGIPEMNAETPTSESKESVLDGEVCFTESSGIPKQCVPETSPGGKSVQGHVEGQSSTMLDEDTVVTADTGVDKTKSDDGETSDLHSQDSNVQNDTPKVLKIEAEISIDSVPKICALDNLSKVEPEFNISENQNDKSHSKDSEPQSAHVKVDVSAELEKNVVCANNNGPEMVCNGKKLFVDETSNISSDNQMLVKELRAVTSDGMCSQQSVKSDVMSSALNLGEKLEKTSACENDDNDNSGGVTSIPDQSNEGADRVESENLEMSHDLVGASATFLVSSSNKEVSQKVMNICVEKDSDEQQKHSEVKDDILSTESATMNISDDSEGKTKFKVCNSETCESTKSEERSFNCGQSDANTGIDKEIQTTQNNSGNKDNSFLKAVDLVEVPKCQSIVENDDIASWIQESLLGKVMEHVFEQYVSPTQENIETVCADGQQLVPNVIKKDIEDAVESILSEVASNNIVSDTEYEGNNNVSTAKAVHADLDSEGSSLGLKPCQCQKELDSPTKIVSQILSEILDEVCHIPKSPLSVVIPDGHGIEDLGLDEGCAMQFFEHNLKSPSVILKHLELKRWNKEVNDFMNSSDDSNEKMDEDVAPQGKVIRCKPSIMMSPVPSNNFSSIAFGSQGEVNYVCGVCKKHFSESDALLRHHLKKHPSVDFSYIEVEEGNDIDLLFYNWPCNYGLLASSQPFVDDCRNLEVFTCTRCGSTFKHIHRLHVHIINCDPKNYETLASKRRKYRRKMRKQMLEAMNAKKNEKLNNKTSGNPPRRPGRPKGIHTLHKPKRDGLSTSPKNRKRRNYELLYNPHNHIRRREMTDVLETHQCSGCGHTFKTLSLLERHAKKCDGRDKLQKLKPVQNSLMEDLTQKPRHTCRYCSKHFTYLKSLVNHYRAFCSVRKSYQQKGKLSKEDYEDEEELQRMIKKLEQAKVESKEELEESYIGRKKGGWPRGMKRKNRRKRHCWTYVKKKKPDEKEESESGLFDPMLWNPEVDWMEQLLLPGQEEEDTEEEVEDAKPVQKKKDLNVGRKRTESVEKAKKPSPKKKESPVQSPIKVKESKVQAKTTSSTSPPGNLKTERAVSPKKKGPVRSVSEATEVSLPSTPKSSPKKKITKSLSMIELSVEGGKKEDTLVLSESEGVCSLNLGDQASETPLSSPEKKKRKYVRKIPLEEVLLKKRKNKMLKKQALMASLSDSKTPSTTPDSSPEKSQKSCALKTVPVKTTPVKIAPKAVDGTTVAVITLYPGDNEATVFSKTNDANTEHSPLSPKSKVADKTKSDKKKRHKKALVSPKEPSGCNSGNPVKLKGVKKVGKVTTPKKKNVSAGSDCLKTKSNDVQSKKTSSSKKVKSPKSSNMGSPKAGIVKKSPVKSTSARKRQMSPMSLLCNETLSDSSPELRPSPGKSSAKKKKKETGSEIKCKQVLDFDDSDTGAEVIPRKRPKPMLKCTIQTKISVEQTSEPGPESDISR